MSEGQSTLGSHVIITDRYMEEVNCPFCFFKGYLYQFILLRKNKEVGKRGECPDCRKGMLLSTLTTPMTAEEYGKFVYGYCCIKDGYEKFSWSKLKQRVKEAGISYRFWYGFNKAKRERHHENPTVEEQYKDFLAGLKTPVNPE